MMKPLLRLPFRCVVTALCATLSLAAPARADVIAACAGSSAIRNAEVNVVVLPYFPSSAKSSLGGLGVQLALLLKMETLYRALSYDGWGVLLLTGNKKQCDKDVVTRTLLNGGSVAPGGRLIVVWGNVYTQDNDVYVQTFARAVTNVSSGDTAKRADVVVKLGTHTYTANIGHTDFAFPPEQLTRADIASIDASFHKSAFLYDKPSLSARRRALPIPNTGGCGESCARVAFSVEGRTGSWIKVRTSDGRSGYLAARSDGNSLMGRLLPEVAFVHGLMGYMRYKPAASYGNAAAPPDDASARAGMRAAESSLADYARREQTDDEPEAKAAALQMSGILRYALGMPGLVEQFNAAHALAPYDADARNIAALFSLRQSYLAPGQTLRPRDVMNDFVAVAALDPSKPLGLANLQNFCEFMMEPESALKIVPEAALTSAQVQSWLARVKVAAYAPR